MRVNALNVYYGICVIDRDNYIVGKECIFRLNDTSSDIVITDTCAWLSALLSNRSIDLDFSNEEHILRIRE